jgi:predicted enzyme related to lactoylglutathione lyase
MVSLSYINLFSTDIDRLATFYTSLLSLKEIEASRSLLFRGFRTDGGAIGFSALGAYDLLGLSAREGVGDQALLTFDVGSRAEVDRLTEIACSMGAGLVRAPFETYYGWYQSVLRDPDGNAFRLNDPGVTALHRAGIPLGGVDPTGAFPSSTNGQAGRLRR